APERSTTHLAAADESGLAVNITQTLGSSYGSGVVIGRAGIAMNNGHHWCCIVTVFTRDLADDLKGRMAIAQVGQAVYEAYS
ncbi:MAG TPA: gamma-glutamyltransferase, partial [bacterium]